MQQIKLVPPLFQVIHHMTEAEAKVEVNLESNSSTSAITQSKTESIFASFCKGNSGDFYPVFTSHPLIKSLFEMMDDEKLAEECKTITQPSKNKQSII
jgi:phosphoenolpyruvate carboxylase